jgi:hypothetical protein
MKQSSTSTGLVSHLDFLTQLGEIALRLESAYSVCITAQVALDGQNSDRDREIAHCLRSGVSDVIATMSERLAGIVVSLGRTEGLARSTL